MRELSLDKYQAYYNAFIDLLNENDTKDSTKIIEDTIAGIEDNDYKKLKQQIIWQIGEKKLSFNIEDVEALYTQKLKEIESQPKDIDPTISNLLDEPEISAQYLDIGIINYEGQENLYYGINLGNRESLILSNHTVLRNAEEKWKDKIIGENQIKKYMSYSGYIGDIANSWSRQGIKSFLTEHIKTEPKTVYKLVKGKIDYFMDFDKFKNSSTVQACWVMATYVYPLFYWFPHILINAPSGSGKTKNGFVLVQLSFRGYDLGASAGVTPAQIFRTIECNRGTILIDEFEKSDDDTQKLVNQVINASCTKNAYVIRTEQIDKKWKAWKFPIFCPKIVCNITGINPTSLSRFIGFNLLKTNTEKGKRKPTKQKELEQFGPIRNQLHILMLQHWAEIKNIYETIEIDLSNRDEDNWLPICAVAKWIGDDVFEEVMDFIKSYKDLVIETNDITESLFLTISENVTDSETYYSAKEIASWMVDELSMFKSPDRFVGRKLTEFKFKASHKRNGNCYLLSKKVINDILNRYFPNGTKETSQTSQTSLTPTTSQTSLKCEVSEHCELISDGISLKDQAISFIKANPKCSAQDISKALSLNDEQTKNLLDMLSTIGEVFESPADCWSVLE